MTRSRRSRNYMDDDEEDVDFREEGETNEDDEISEEFEQDPQPEPPKEEPPKEEEDDDEESDDNVRTRKRSRKRVNYNEDAVFASLNDDDDFKEDSDEEVKSKKRKKTDDDEDFAAPGEIANDPDDFLDSDSSIARQRRHRNRGFIVKDDGSEEADYEYDDSVKSHKSGRLSRRRLRQSDFIADTSGAHDDEPLTLQDELKQLQNDSPLNSPKQYNLRERKQVNYTIPPPLLPDAQLEDDPAFSGMPFGTSPRRGRVGRYGTTNNSSYRRLFPTVGPFGGSDVQSIFGGNGTIGADGLTALGNAESSDSDDDNELFKATDPNDTSHKMNIITADGMPGGPGVKKKNTLADTDPLGIDTNIDFSAVGGLNNYIDQLKEMITLPLLYPEVYSKFHITPPRGVLFHGPPGTGKTLMARALAASCSSQGKKITFFMRKGADCLSKWVGEAERHLRLLFEEAKQQQPSIIFFDEIDGLAPVRSSKQEQIHASIVSTLLALMDGMDNRGQVIVVGATNRPDSVDPALRRPGRFDREFYFPLPDMKSREEILNIHMRKWENKLNPEFVKDLSKLTKGYGGADLRALCTESALNSIQRAYPQIYKSDDKLKININKIKVTPNDFTRALNKIIPSSARSTSLSASPLPEHIEPLLKTQLANIKSKLDLIVPNKKPPTVLEESEYVDLTLLQPDGGFKHQQLLSRLNQMRVFKPRLLISGAPGSGQSYITNAVLHSLEGFNIQILDFAKLHSDTSISPENIIIQMFQELRRHKPSVLYVPDILSFVDSITPSIKSTITNMVRNISSNDQILILGMVENDELLTEVDYEYELDLKKMFQFSIKNKFELSNPDTPEIEEFYSTSWNSIKLTPIEFDDLSTKPKRKLKELKVIKVDTTEKQQVNKKKEKEQIMHDMRLKNLLKVRLSGMMETCKNRFRRFRKPPIDDSLLVHLFEDNDLTNSAARYQRQNDKILDTQTGKLFYNMDLDIVEERLWNGYYSEPKQFSDDIALIVKDAEMTGDHERITRSKEMLAHVMVGIDEIRVPFPQLFDEWKDVRVREKKMQQELLEKKMQQGLLEKQEKLKLQEAQEILQLPAPVPVPPETAESVTEVLQNGDGDQQSVEKVLAVEQTQVQSQLVPNQFNNNSNTVENGTVAPVPYEVPDETDKMELEKEVIEKESIDLESSDEEVEVPPLEKLILDESRLNNLKQELILKSKQFNIEKLEFMNSKIIETVFIHRMELDKTELLNDLEKVINEGIGLD